MFEELYEWFTTYGMVWALVGLFVILVIDATIFPALPELFAVLAFSLNPTFWWGVTVLVIALLAEVTGNSLLYFLVRRKRLPRFIRRVMKKWVRFLVIKDERIILMNRIAPVVPFLGAFMATCKWNYRKSMLFLLIGGVAKYTALLLLVHFILGIEGFDPGTARLVTVIMILIIVGLSFISSYIYKKRLKKDKKEGL